MFGDIKKLNNYDSKAQLKQSFYLLQIYFEMLPSLFSR